MFIELVGKAMFVVGIVLMVIGGVVNGIDGCPTPDHLIKALFKVGGGTTTTSIVLYYLHR